MREIVCTEAGGWQGIVAALAQAQPGDVVQLRAGRYAGTDTLFVPSGVSLVGAAGVVLCFDADAPAVRFREVEGSRLADLKIEIRAASVAQRAFPEAPVSGDETMIEWGLVYVERSRTIRLSAIEIEAPLGRLAYLNAITLWASRDCAVSDCRIRSVGLDGIVLGLRRL